MTETAMVQSPGRQLAFDFVRVAALLGVILYHSAAAYSTNTPYWSVHDGSSTLATVIRELVDVFVMPIFFFLAGYFTLSSLRKRGYWSFFKSKFWELEYIWLWAVIIILPIVWWGTEVKSSGASTGFVSYWLTWLGGIGQTHLGVLTAAVQNVHMHFWFVSLLFYFFVIFILGSLVKDKLTGTSLLTRTAQPSSKNPWVVFILFALIITVGYFISLLFVPDMSWLTVKLFLQFQPSKLFLYIAFFGFGLYAYSRSWFTDNNPFDRLRVWVPATVLLAVAFWFVGQDVFLHPETTTSMSPIYLLLFAVVRSLFLLSVMMTAISIGMRYFNQSSRLIHALSDNSYYIYLIHIFIVAILQDILMIWPNGPVIVKITIVFLIALSLSYVLSRWVFRKIKVRDWAARKLFHREAIQTS